MDLQLGFPPHKRGQLRCKDGVLYGVDMAGKPLPAAIAQPKIYLPSGNCLAGLIRDKQSMAVAWLSSGGVDQMVGYVVSTWYGRGGWGTQDYFFSEPGRYTLSDAFYFNNQSITWQLQTRFPEVADVDFNEWNIETDPRLSRSARRRARLYRGRCRTSRTISACTGTTTPWPSTAIPPGKPASRRSRRSSHRSCTIDGDRYTFTIHADDECTSGRPPAMLLPRRVKDIKIVEGQQFKPLVTANFIMVMEPGKLEKGETSQRRLYREGRPSRSGREEAKTAASGDVPHEYRTTIDQQFISSLTSKPGSRARKYRRAVAAQFALPAERPPVGRGHPGRAQEQRRALPSLSPTCPQPTGTLSKDFLLTNLRYAYQARAKSPGARNCRRKSSSTTSSLTPASTNAATTGGRIFTTASCRREKLQDGRRGGDPLEQGGLPAVGRPLYATQRPKPDQSPYESAQAKFASCTGLSVIAVDAFRAVAIPARLAGVPLWTGGPATIVGRRFGTAVGTSSPLRNRNRSTMPGSSPRPREADPADPLNRIYATSFTAHGTSLPADLGLARQTVPAWT